MDAPSVRLVGVSWVAMRTGLHRSTVQEAARDGRLPGFFLCNAWKFDPAEIEAWVSARSNQSRTTDPTLAQAEPSSAAPAARHHQGRRASDPTPESTPSLVVLFPNAAHRGVYDELPADEPTATQRPGGRRRARTTRAALPR